ncbi:hypothetical protein EJB05_48887, partial [Eragrostis curvula]
HAAPFDSSDARRTRGPTASLHSPASTEARPTAAESSPAREGNPPPNARARGETNQAAPPPQRARRALTAAATAPPAPKPAAKRKGQADASSPSSSKRGSRRAFAVVMAASLLALAVAFLVGAGAGVDRSAAATVEVAGSEVTFGSVVKLMHEKTKHRLHSHDVPYGSGSGQQSVTGFPEGDDGNSYWIVRPTPDSSAKQGDAIETGSIIKLQHMRTRRWLHSHLHASPLSGNLEVSCFGGDGQSDTGDYWRLEIEGTGKVWKRDQKIRLKHVDTGGYLHSHNKKYNRLGGGQQEVCGVREKRAENIWLAAEGVYLPANGSK